MLEKVYLKSLNKSPIFVKGYGTVEPEQLFLPEELELSRPLGWEDKSKHRNTFDEIRKYGFAWFPVAGDCDIPIEMKAIRLIEVDY